MYVTYKNVKIYTSKTKHPLFHWGQLSIATSKNSSVIYIYIYIYIYIDIDIYRYILHIYRQYILKVYKAFLQPQEFSTYNWKFQTNLLWLFKFQFLLDYTVQQKALVKLIAATLLFTVYLYIVLWILSLLCKLYTISNVIPDTR